MKTNRIPIFELLTFSLTIIIFNMAGYFFFWQGVTDRSLSNWQSIIFTSIFLIALISMLLFFRKTLISINRLVDEKFDLQKTYLDQLNHVYEGTLKALIYALDARDHGTWGHSARVVGYALAIAEKIGLYENQLRQLAWAGLLHDIGKIGIPDAILFKETSLSMEEWENVKRHPVIGFEVIREIDFLKFAADIVLSHHEHFDGTGYPKGLKEEQIPLEARIFAIADALDAMTSNRPYRAARSMTEAINEVKKLSGKQFCPRCVSALEQIGMEELHKIQKHVKEISDITNMRSGLDPLIYLSKNN